MLWVGTIGAGFGVSSLFSQGMMLLSNHAATTGRAVGLLLLAASLGALSGPFVVRMMAESHTVARGYEPLMWVVISCCVAALVTIQRFLRTVQDPMQSYSIVGSTDDEDVEAHEIVPELDSVSDIVGKQLASVFQTEFEQVAVKKL